MPIVCDAVHALPAGRAVVREAQRRAAAGIGTRFEISASMRLPDDGRMGIASASLPSVPAQRSTAADPLRDRLGKAWHVGIFP